LDSSAERKVDARVARLRTSQMISTKNKKNIPQLTRRAALTTRPGVFVL